MTKYELVLPTMGEGVMEATIIKWLKEEGDLIHENDSLVEIATDKVDSDIPSEKSGILMKIHKQVNQVVRVGEVIAEIQIEEYELEEIPLQQPDAIKLNKNISLGNEISFVEKSALNLSFKDPFIQTRLNSNSIFLSPLVKSIVKQENISPKELSSIQGSGMKGRITKNDLSDFLSQRNATPNHPKLQNNHEDKLNTKSIIEVTSSKVVISPNDEIIEMDRMRSLISNYMVESKKISPHVTSFIEADVTNLVLWKNKNKTTFFKEYSEKLTFTPLFVHAIVKAITHFPMINISVIENKIIKKKNINIGIATALPNGNLTVPVVKNADHLSVAELAKSINNLVEKARTNKLKPSDITEGTYTITNIGTFGNLMGTPIINQPQVAIMAVGVIQKKVSVLETPTGDQIAIRHKMYLSHTYDHRVVDGSLGGIFLKRVADYLENFNLDMKI